jgi:hypothetical protein
MDTPEIAAIKIEKRLCGALMRSWSPSGMSVETLANDAADEIERLRRELSALRGVDQSACKHSRQTGLGSASSDGSSSFTGHCLDCGKDVSYSIKGALADPMIQLTSRN